MNNLSAKYVKIVGVPHFTDMGEKSYLSAYYKLINTYRLSDSITLIPPVYSQYQEMYAYHFYMYELQLEAFNEVLTALSKYNYKELSINLFDRFEKAPDIEYFDNLLNLVENLENLKK